MEGSNAMQIHLAIRRRMDKNWSVIFFCHIEFSAICQELSKAVPFMVHMLYHQSHPSLSCAYFSVCRMPIIEWFILGILEGLLKCKTGAISEYRIIYKRRGLLNLGHDRFNYAALCLVSSTKVFCWELDSGLLRYDFRHSIFIPQHQKIPAHRTAVALWEFQYMNGKHINSSYWINKC